MDSRMLPMSLFAVFSTLVVPRSSASAQRVSLGVTAGAAFPYGPMAKGRGPGWRAAASVGLGETNSGATGRLELGHASFPGKRGFDGISSNNAIVFAGVAGGAEQVRLLARVGAGVHDLRKSGQRGASGTVVGIAGGVGLRLGRQRAVSLELRSDGLLSDYGNSDGAVVTFNSFVVGFSM